jgi:hypothetical protein
VAADVAAGPCKGAAEPRAQAQQVRILCMKGACGEVSCRPIGLGVPQV